VAVLVVASLLDGRCGLDRTGRGAASRSRPGRGPIPMATSPTPATRLGIDDLVANVSELKEAWSFTLTGKATKSDAGTGLAANPIVQERRRLPPGPRLERLRARARDGQAAMWEYDVNQPEKSGPGPNGVAVADGTVYGATPTSVFALNAATGNEDLGQPTISSARARARSASSPRWPTGGSIWPASTARARRRVLLALNASTGKCSGSSTRCSARPGRRGRQARRRRRVGDAAGRQRRIGDLRHRQPLPNRRLGDRPSRRKQLYTDSDVNLDAATGKLRWYYQGVPNDFKDYDMQASPIAATHQRRLPS
jgi:hypothetical protein